MNCNNTPKCDKPCGDCPPERRPIPEGSEYGDKPKTHIMTTYRLLDEDEANAAQCPPGHTLIAVQFIEKVRNDQQVECSYAYSNGNDGARPAVRMFVQGELIFDYANPALSDDLAAAMWRAFQAGRASQPFVAATHPQQDDHNALLHMIAGRAAAFPSFPMGYHMPELFDAVGMEPPQRKETKQQAGAVSAAQSPAEGAAVGAALRTGLEMAQELLAMKREALGDDYRLTRNYWEAEREITAAIAALESQAQPKAAEVALTDDQEREEFVEEFGEDPENMHPIAWEAWKARAARSNVQPKHAACEYCNGTGDVHGLDGEWRGECNQCPAAAQAHQPDASAAVDARRYRRLQILGAAPFGSKNLDNGTVMRFQSLDAFVDADIDAHPSRGESAQPEAAHPQHKGTASAAQGEQAIELVRKFVTYHYTDEPDHEPLIEAAWRILQCDSAQTLARSDELNEKAGMPHSQALELAISEGCAAHVQPKGNDLPAVPCTWKKPGESDDAWLDRITGASQAPAPGAGPLTDEQIVRIYERPDLAGTRHASGTEKAIAIARAIEAAHGIKG